MWTKIREFIRRERRNTRDIAIDPVSAAVGGSALGLSPLGWVLIALVCAGVIFAIVKIVKISKKKKLAQAE